MSFKKWIIGKADRETAKTLADECGIDPFSALLACTRGITDPSELEFMLSDEPILCDPRELADIKKASEVILNAVSEGRKIAVFGDYDCDGVIASTIMYKSLLRLGADATVYIPNRISEGYGMSNQAVDKLKALDVGLIITVDNGISCCKEIEYAASLGIETVVTDHHLPPVVLPSASAVVDPHRVDCCSSFKEICGAQVAFKLACVILDKEPEELLPDYADLLSVAVLGDVMPLVNENRSIVKAGIKKIKTNPNIGISAVLSVAGIDRKAVNSGKISFGIVPRINAAGRLGDAFDAFNLLCLDNMSEAISLANVIDRLNAQRQQTERSVAESAMAEVDKNGYRHDRVIVVSGENWHIGIVGIVASRICEKYGKPTIVLSVENGTAHGSGRSIKGFNLYNALDACSEHLTAYGGHELAGGVSLDVDKIDSFRKSINEYAKGQKPAVPAINIDFKINPAGMSLDMVYAIRLLEPFGTGNPSPIFGIMGVKLEKITPVGAGKHLKLLFSRDGGAFQAMLFGVDQKHFCCQPGDILDLAVSLDSNLFRDEYILCVQIKDLRPSGIDDGLIFDQLNLLDDFLSGGAADNRDVLLPAREQIGVIYKHICANSPTPERLKYSFLNTYGVAKTVIAVKVLEELGLVCKKNGLLVCKSTGKTELIKSQTYRLLLSEVTDG